MKWLGVDGCRGGWLAVLLDDDGPNRFEIVAPIGEIARFAARRALIDIPIGLPESGRRSCDLAARELLGAARSRVFLDARRPLLGFASYAAASAWAKADGKGISKQLFNILPKIGEADRFIDRARQDVFVEAHPELVFQRLNGGEALPSKKTADGLQRRRALVAAHGIADVASWEAALPRAAARVDDLLDACALAIAARTPAGPVPCRAETDARGLRMEIWR